MTKIVGLIGYGIGYLALSIRLANQGFKVTNFEKNSYPEGKLSELNMNGIRFDKGPSLSTMTVLIDELTNLLGSSNKFEYQKLKIITNYFYADGTQLKAFANLEKFATEVNLKLDKNKETVLKHIKRHAFYFKTTVDLFLKQSLHQLKNLINIKTVKAILFAPFLGLFITMHIKTRKLFRIQKMYNCLVDLQPIKVLIFTKQLP
jgi:phytoene dehydrogenase-like protein